MKLQYCPISKGILLLNKNTNTEWRPISPLFLSQNRCAATILPVRFNNSFPILSQYCYLPKNFYNSTSPERLYSSFKTGNQRVLKVMPSVKYSLDGVKLSLIRTFSKANIFIEVEGIISLTGDIVVKPTDGMNPTLILLNNKSGKITLIRADMAKTEFISSLKIHNFTAEGKPSLTIGSSFTDKISMTATNIEVMLENINSAKISASFTPHYYEVTSNFGLTLEIQIGYEFSGKATYYPLSNDSTKPLSTPHSSTEGKKIIAGGLAAGVVIMCVFAPELAATLLLAT